MRASVEALFLKITYLAEVLSPLFVPKVGEEPKKLKITGKYDTICIIHKNRPGIIRDVTAIIADFDINVNYLESVTGTMGKIGYTFISVDQDLPDEIVERINTITDIDRTYLIRRL